MERTILVTVGISLVTDRLTERERANAGFGDLDGVYHSLNDLIDALTQADEWPDSFNPEARQWVSTRHGLARKLAEIWGRAETTLSAAIKRSWSGAELASLHLLGKDEESEHAPLSETDRVILLASETPSGQVCAGIVAEVLRQGVLGVVPGRVEVKPMKGLRANDATSFLTKGLPTTAKTLSRHRMNSLLIASGGYKGLLPYLTPIAMQMRIPLFYLYEESDRLLEIRPISVSEDLTLIRNHLDAFNLIDPTVGEREIHAHLFWDRVEAAGDREARGEIRAKGWVVETDGRVKLTPTGVLVCLMNDLVMQNG